MSKPPFESCPRFAGCSVNVCPLDPEIDKRSRLPDEPLCTLAKTHRARIAAGFPGLLPFGGLYRAEWTRRAAAQKRWAAMTADQKSARIAVGTAALGRLRNTAQAMADGRFIVAVTDDGA